WRSSDCSAFPSYSPDRSRSPSSRSWPYSSFDDDGVEPPGVPGAVDHAADRLATELAGATAALRRAVALAGGPREHGRRAGAATRPLAGGRGRRGRQGVDHPARSRPDRRGDRRAPRRARPVLGHHAPGGRRARGGRCLPRCAGDRAHHGSGGRPGAPRARLDRRRSSPGAPGMMLVALLVIPLAGAVLSWRAVGRLATTLHTVTAVLTLVGALAVAVTVNRGEPLVAFDGFLRADALSAWMIALIGIVGALAASEAPRY